MQHSQFLQLPAEIRNCIYQHALVRDDPLDLCPDDFIQDSEHDLALAQRTKHWHERLPTFTRKGRRIDNSATRVSVRRQKDLHYLRTEMAPALLSTCAQIHREASHMFWGLNTFRFSCDWNWQILLRFLSTIGSARALLRRLDVCSPFYNHCWGPEHYINHPKLRLEKLQLEPDFAHRLSNEQCYHQICYLLAQEKTLKELNLIISLESTFEARLNGPNLPDSPLLTIYDLKFAKITIVVESPACLYQHGSPKRITELGLHLLCLPGSYMPTSTTGQQPHKPEIYERLTKSRRWEPCTISDPIDGMQQLFKDLELSVHGSCTKFKAQRKLARVLNGFGPPVLAVTKYFCMMCNKDWGEDTKTCCSYLRRCQNNPRRRNYTRGYRRAEISYQCIPDVDRWTLTQRSLPSSIYVNLCNVCYVRAVKQAQCLVADEPLGEEYYQKLTSGSGKCICRTADKFLLLSSYQLDKVKVLQKESEEAHGLVC